MLFANDYNDNRVHIDDTHSNQGYYCPYCGAPLMTKKGKIRQHHFAHKKTYHCKDSWERENSYNISLWHNEWQALFPKENQEIRLSLGNIVHRADVMVNRTVVEFQHSTMSFKSFEDRNNFYFNLGYKVVWLFDLIDLYKNKQLSYEQRSSGLIFDWSNPKKAFNNIDIKKGNIDLFFQLSDDENCIVKVLDVSEGGFECFYSTRFISKQDFLSSYVGMNNGKCLPPFRMDIEDNRQYELFKKNYNIDLSKQQERAVQAIEGANLLLAVPGSGKTTVLIARLGYMILNKHIDPKSILAVTYNKQAVEEMKERFSSKFGKNIGDEISFKTINSVALGIYSRYCSKAKKNQYKLIKEDERHKILREIYRKYNEKEAAEYDILDLSSAITYIKNMMLDEEEIKNLKTDFSNLGEMYQAYRKALKQLNRMDFDDQMVFAHWVLRNDSEITNELRNQYKYICIDEAQDTSKIQHEIIKILSQGNNIFIVGDEDQSIYGFRAAYPKALLNFRYDYVNPYILRMERNYRSTVQIVKKAQTFISKNRGRYEKNMIADRTNGKDVYLERVNSRESQYMRLLEIAKNAHENTAFLYRDNDSSVILVDLFCRNNIPFKLCKPEMNFFKCRIVRDIVAYLSLATNERDTDSFETICNKGILYLKGEQKSYAIRNCKKRKISIFDAVEEQMQYVEYKYRGRAEKFRTIIERIKNEKPLNAIEILCNEGYERYLQKNEYFDDGKIEILRILAKQEYNIKDFLARLKRLEQIIFKEDHVQDKDGIILSTIHSSKGLEYDNVYMVDVYDGKFPSVKPSIVCNAKDSGDLEQEERRLFYVGITRAKNFLQLFSIKDKRSIFIEDIFPAEREIVFKNEEKYPIDCGARQRKERKEAFIRKNEDERSEIDYRNRYNAIKDKFIQQDSPIYDSSGTRWAQCEICRRIKETDDFYSYGGPGHINLGVCKQCQRKEK